MAGGFELGTLSLKVHITWKIHKEHAGVIPNKYPLYKVYMGLIIKGPPSQRVPPFFPMKDDRGHIWEVARFQQLQQQPGPGRQRWKLVGALVWNGANRNSNSYPFLWVNGRIFHTWSIWKLEIFRLSNKIRVPKLLGKLSLIYFVFRDSTLSRLFVEMVASQSLLGWNKGTHWSLADKWWNSTFPKWCPLKMLMFRTSENDKGNRLFG